MVNYLNAVVGADILKNLAVDQSLQTGTIINKGFYFLVGAVALIWLIFFCLSFSKKSFNAKGMVAFFSIISFAIFLATLAIFIINLVSDKSILYVFFALLIMSAVAIISGLLYAIMRKSRLVIFRFRKLIKFITSLLIAFLTIIFVVSIVYLQIKYGQNSAEWIRHRVYLIPVMIMPLIFAYSLTLGLFDVKANINKSALVNGFIAIVMAMVLEMLPIAYISNGVKISLAAVIPLLIYSYLYGNLKGLLVVLIFSTFLGIQHSASIASPIEFFLMYVLAYVPFSFVGLFASKRNKRITFSVVATLIFGFVARFGILFASAVVTFYTASKPASGSVADLMWPVGEMVIFEFVVSFTVLVMMLMIPKFKKLAIKKRMFNLALESAYIDADKRTY